MLATVSVELSVNRKSFSPTLNVSVGTTNSPATTPFLSACSVVENVGLFVPTDVTLPFDLAEPVPVESSPAANPPAAVTVTEDDPELMYIPLVAPTTEVVVVPKLPEILFTVIVAAAAFTDCNVAVAVAVEFENVIDSPIIASGSTR